MISRYIMDYINGSGFLAIKYAHSKGIVLVTDVGNEGDEKN